MTLSHLDSERDLMKEVAGRKHMSLVEQECSHHLTRTITESNSSVVSITVMINTGSKSKTVMSWSESLRDKKSKRMRIDSETQQQPICFNQHLGTEDKKIDPALLYRRKQRRPLRTDKAVRSARINQ